MRHTELWRRLERTLGPAYYEYWAGSFAITELQSQTVREALAAGTPPKEVWEAVHRVLELPASER
ncbi:DUF3046 domain-containing protein [Nocardioides sp.]|uniref:DUF3046 domain-containing protein n=1 Tax=Nocardioides sp. TaxID=35761 RepID=UPI0039E55D84